MLDITMQLKIPTSNNNYLSSHEKESIIKKEK